MVDEDMDNKKVGIVLILVGLATFLISFLFSQGYDSDWGFLGSILSMGIDLNETGYYIPYKFILAGDIILVSMGIGFLIIPSKNKNIFSYKMSTDAPDVSHEKQKEDKATSVSDTKLTDPLKPNGRKLCEECGIEYPEGEFPSGLNICKSCAGNKLKTKTLEKMIFTQTQQDTDIEKTVKKPRPIGWGWFVLLLQLAYATNPYMVGSHVPKFYDAFFSVTYRILWIPMLILYFILRCILIKKKSISSEPLRPGLIAGISVLVIFSLVSVGLRKIDKQDFGDKIKILSERYANDLNNLDMEAKNLTALLVSNPETDSDIQKNIRVVDQSMVYLYKRQAFVRNMLNDYKFTFKDKDLPKSGKSCKQLIDEALAMNDKMTETGLQEFVALRQYYLTRDAQFYDEYSGKLQKADVLLREYMNTVNQLRESEK